MAEIYRPGSFRDVSVYLVLQQGQGSALIQFLKQAFNAVEVFLASDPDGRIAHAELRVGDTIVELG